LGPDRESWIENRRPFTWTKTADEILRAARRRQPVINAIVGPVAVATICGLVAALAALIAASGR
jgi:hypothetical protein